MEEAELLGFSVATTEVTSEMEEIGLAIAKVAPFALLMGAALIYTFKMMLRSSEKQHKEAQEASEKERAEASETIRKFSNSQAQTSKECHLVQRESVEATVKTGLILDETRKELGNQTAILGEMRDAMIKSGK